MAARKINSLSRVVVPGYFEAESNGYFKNGISRGLQ